MPKKITPLRQVRIATELSQKQFADLVGIKYDLYQSLELGRAKLTEENAEKILRATGALPKSLDPKQSRCPMSFETPGEPYSAKTWLAWENDKAPIERGVSSLARDLICWTQFMCLVALQEKKFWHLHNVLSKAVAECASECRLDMQKALTRQLRYHLQQFEYSYGELRQNPELAKTVGFVEKPNKQGHSKPDDAIWIKRIPLAGLVSWDPSAQMPLSLQEKIRKSWSV